MINTGRQEGMDTPFGREGSKGSEGVVSPSAMNIKSGLRDFPPGTVILSPRRRVSVHTAFETTSDKYQSAGSAPGFRIF